MLSHEASLAMAQMDTDRNGEVDFQELLSYAQVSRMLIDGLLHSVHDQLCDRLGEGCSIHWC